MVAADTPERAEVPFGAFFDNAQTPLLIVDDDLQIVKANRQAKDMLELDAGKGLLDGFWSVSATAVMRLAEGVRRGVPAAPVSARTASDRLVEVDAFAMDGTPFVGVMVTDRATVDEAQRRLKEQEERYRSLFEWSPTPMREEDFTAVGVWLDRLRASGVTDLRRHMADNPEDVQRAIMSIRTSRVNAAGVELLKAPSMLAILRGFRDIELTPQVLRSFEEQFLTLWEGGNEHSADFVGVNYLGQPFECRLRWIVPQSSRGRDLSRVAVSLMDLTQLRATERRLERLVADKDRFIASVSHELRTPLAAVFGLSEELSLNWEQFAESESRELIGLVAAQSAELSAIVEDLLVAANIESGRVAIGAEEVDVDQAVADALADCRRSHPELGEIDIEGRGVRASADVVRVRQIVRNLITNAIRYGGEHISLRVGHGTRPFVEVIDDGAGVSLEHREAIFDPYFQASSGERVLGSLGLGLSISRELARRMGGDLGYSYVDGHSIFRLDLRPV
ncbi:MAG: HAMP domain-containing sensor histidine kinase [Acidimicrobiia bacterium]|nr:HAMP domain-containing sensor histidine kinase [Acidimicrobiia bacterium]